MRTLPDIYFDNLIMARHLNAPEKCHIVLNKRAVQYIPRTANNMIFYSRSSGNSKPLISYADADWAGFQDSRKLTTGILMKFNGPPLYWTSKRQPLVFLSSVEVEHVSLFQCGKQILYLRRIVTEFKPNTPISNEPDMEAPGLITDSTSASSVVMKP